MCHLAYLAAAKSVSAIMLGFTDCTCMQLCRELQAGTSQCGSNIESNDARGMTLAHVLYSSEMMYYFMSSAMQR